MRLGWIIMREIGCRALPFAYAIPAVFPAAVSLAAARTILLSHKLRTAHLPAVCSKEQPATGLPSMAEQHPRVTIRPRFLYE